MFYGQRSGGDSAGVVIGPISISLQSLMIGIQSSLVIVPVSVAVVILFKNLKAKTPGKEHKHEVMQPWNENMAVNHKFDSDTAWKDETIELEEETAACTWTPFK